MPKKNTPYVSLSSNATCYSHGELLITFDHSYIESGPSYVHLTMEPQDFQNFSKWLYSEKGEYSCSVFSARFSKIDEEEKIIDFEFVSDIFPEPIAKKGKKIFTSFTFKDSELHLLKMNTLHTAYMYALEQNNLKADFTHLSGSMWTVDHLVGVEVIDNSSLPLKKFEVYFPYDWYYYDNSRRIYDNKDDKYAPYASYLDLDYKKDEVFLHSYMPNAFFSGSMYEEFKIFSDEWNKNNTIQIETTRGSEFGCYMYSFISLSDCASQQNIYDYLYQTLYVKPNESISYCFKKFLDEHMYYTKQTLDTFNLVEKLKTIPNTFDYYQDHTNYIRVFIPCTPIETPKKTHLLVQISQEKIYLANGRMNLRNATWKEEYEPSENIFDQIMDGIKKHGYKIR